MADSIPYDAATDWEDTVSNIESSTRLDLEHCLSQNTLGYLLDPRIEASLPSKPFAVADFGCGTGAWLIDLERDLFEKGLSARLDGFDVCSDHFPAPKFLPNSITLIHINNGLPEILKTSGGIYDVIHTRTLGYTSVDSDLDWIPELLVMLLKPGGWIQWEKSPAQYHIEAPAPDVSTTGCEAVARMLNTIEKEQGLLLGFARGVDQLLKENGFKKVSINTHQKRKQDLKAWTNVHIMYWRELRVYFPPKAEAPFQPVNREMFMGMLIGAENETRNGVVIHHDQIMSAIGQKPATTESTPGEVATATPKECREE